MKKTMLFQTLSTFTRGELRRWSAFVHSDYHCKNKYLRFFSKQLLLIFKQQQSVQKVVLWKAMFPNKAYNEIKFNNYQSDLLAVTYRFLEIESFSDQTNTRFEYLQNQLSQRGLSKQAKRVAKKWHQHLEHIPHANASALFDQYRYHSTQNNFGIINEGKRTFGAHLRLKSIAFEHYFLLQQLSNYAEILNSQHIIKGEYELSYLEELLSRYERNNLNEQNIKSIEILVLIVQMLTEQDAEHRFVATLALMKEESDCFKPAENRIIYNYLINFCVKKINSGFVGYYKKLFSIYKVLIDKNILLQNNLITQWTYTNIITIGLRLKEWEWTQHFLEDYQKFLPKNERHNAFNYNLAAFHFEKRAYDKALEPLNELEYADAFYQMAAKIILLKIYYTLQQDDAFEALVAASKQFIGRNKQLSDYQQKSNLNFIRFIQKMAILRQNQAFWPAKKCKDRLNSLKDKLASVDYSMSNKGWLASELEQLL